MVSSAAFLPISTRIDICCEPVKTAKSVCLPFFLQYYIFLIFFSSAVSRQISVFLLVSLFLASRPLCLGQIRYSAGRDGGMGDERKRNGEKKGSSEKEDK